METVSQDSSTPFDAEFVASQIEPGSRVVRVERLPGGVSANVYRLDLEKKSGDIRSMVVRQYGAVDLRSNPHIAKLEMSILRAVTAAGIPAPQPFLVVDDAHQLGSPYLVISYLQGGLAFELDAVPDAGRQLAEVLAHIHGVDVRKARLRGFPNVSSLIRKRILESGPDDAGVTEDGKRDELSMPWTTVNKSVLLHGDFWPGNILWHDGKITGVVDWEDACLGDPLKDVSNCRAELYCLGHEAIMHRFTDAYLLLNRRIDTWSLGFWDVWHASELLERIPGWGFEESARQEAEARMVRFQRWAIEEYPTQSP